MTTQQTLRIDKLQLSCRKHGHWHELVHGISLCVQRGQVLALVGASGSGKSLTCSGLQGILPPGVRRTGGQGLIQEGNDTRPVRPGRDVATIMQNPRSAFNPVLTMRTHARETARFASQPRDIADDELRERLAEVGLTDPRILDLYPFEMSGGMLQRMMITLALISDAPFMVADEPTTDLDLVVQAKILDLLLAVAQERNMGILFVTHDMGVVARMATDVAVMHLGHIIETGPVERIFNHPQHEATRALVQAHLALYPEEQVA